MSFERDYAGRVKRLARLYHGKMLARDASLDIDDVEQEMWIVLHRARASYDPASGIPFDAYFGLCAKRHAVRMARRVARMANMEVVSINDVAGEDDESEIASFIQGDEPDGEQVAIEESQREYVMRSVDDRLRILIQFIRDTPPEIEAQIASARAKAEWAQQMGIKMEPPRRMTLRMIAETLGIGRGAQYRMIERLKQIAEERQ